MTPSPMPPAMLERLRAAQMRAAAIAFATGRSREDMGASFSMARVVGLPAHFPLADLNPAGLRRALRATVSHAAMAAPERCARFLERTRKMVAA